jgi:hypothetical protein
MSDDIRRQFFPYCLQRLSDGRYILLNRYYKPLGLPRTTPWVDYDKHPSGVKIRITAAIAKKLSWQGDSHTNVDVIYLYRDGDILHNGAYLERLGTLMKKRARSNGDGE